LFPYLPLPSSPVFPLFPPLSPFLPSSGTPIAIEEEKEGTALTTGGALQKN